MMAPLADNLSGLRRPLRHFVPLPDYNESLVRPSMVDIHSHILPGIDDGSKDMDQSVAMVEMARQAGTSVLVASPHADTQFKYDPGTIDRLLDELRVRSGPGVQLLRGCDFHLTYDNVEDAIANPSRYTIAGRSYLLMELSDLHIFPSTAEQWSRLERAGMRIILTHPERNSLLRQRFELIEEWVAGGRYMQLTAGSLLGRFGPAAQAFSFRLLDRGLAHFVASDAHDLRARPPRLDEAFSLLSHRYSPELATRLCVENPQAAVDGQLVEFEAAPPPRPGFWQRLMRR